MNATSRKARVAIDRADLPETDTVAIANSRLPAIDGNNQRSINHWK